MDRTEITLCKTALADSWITHRWDCRRVSVAIFCVDGVDGDGHALDKFKFLMIVSLGTLHLIGNEPLKFILVILQRAYNGAIDRFIKAILRKTVDDEDRTDFSSGQHNSRYRVCRPKALTEAPAVPLDLGDDWR